MQEPLPPTSLSAPSAARLSAAELEEFVESANVGMQALDCDGFVRWANAAQLALLGYAHDEYVGHHISEFHVDRAALAATLERLRRGEPVDDWAARMRCKDGTVKDVLVHATGLSRSRRLIHSLTLDATDRRRADATQALLAAIVTASDDAIVGTTLDGGIRSWNTGAERLYGYAADEVIGRPIDIIIPRELRGEERSILQRVGRGERIDHFETVRTAKDGRRIHVSLTVSPIYDQGEIVGLSKVTRDITERKEAERALLESEQRYRAIVESQSEMVCRFRPDGTILFVNGAYARSRGTTPDALLGASFWDFIAPADRPAVEEMLKSLTPEHPEVKIENRFLTPHGPRWTLWTNRALLFDTEGTLLEAQSTGIDITERKRAEEALREREERYELVVAGAQAAIWDWDVPNKRVAFSPRWKELRGLENDDIGDSEQVWLDGIHPEDLPRVMAAVRAHFEGKTKVFSEEYRVRHKAGHWVWILDHGVALRDAEGRVVRMAGSETDITERKRAEEALLEADRRKNDFLATLGHELRNPLAPIRNMLEVLERGDENPELRARARATMIRQLDVIVRLVDDLLDVSRITRGKLQLRKSRIELAPLVQRAIDGVHYLLEEARHDIAVRLPSEPVMLHADPVRIEQVLTNLLSNAAKYTPDGGRIEVVAEHDGDAVRIAVRDNGVGIPPDQLEAIFAMFGQLDHSIERGHKGLGIGLSLVRWLVELHGGMVTARSDGPGKGSEFVVRLPAEPRVAAAPADAEAQAEPVTNESHAARRRVLVVDDNRDAADSLAMLLGMFGHEIQVAFDGHEALTAAEAFRPDVVLLDIGLPKLDGHAVARHIREQPWGARPIIAAVTGWGQESDRLASRDAGCDVHLTKPLTLAKLQEVLQRAPRH